MGLNELFEGVWTEKYRPQTSDDIILSDSNRKFLDKVKSSEEVPNLMLASNPGTGKTSLAKIIVKDILDCQYLYINASEENGINDIRSKVMTFAQTRSIDGKIKVVILDECDGLTSQSQAALRNIMEEYLGTTRFILTCNYPFKVIKALHSRCQDLNVTPPLNDVIKRCINILKQEGVSVPDPQKSRLIELINAYYPDIRRCINQLQKCVVDNTLNIDNINQAGDIAETVFSKLTDKNADPIEIRKYLIENEPEFNADYHTLLKSLFEVIYNCNLSFDKKRNCMHIVSECMYRHNLVMDTEINAFDCILCLFDVISK